MSDTLDAYNRTKRDMFEAPIQPAHVHGVGLKSSLPSMNHHFQGAAANTNNQGPEPQMRPNIDTAQQPVPKAANNSDLFDRASLAGGTLNDNSQKGIRAESAASILGNHMAKIGSELLSGIFGKPDVPSYENDATPDRMPVPGMTPAMRAGSPF